MSKSCNILFSLIFLLIFIPTKAPAMDQKDIDKIEKKLSIKLPEEYKDTVLNYPKQLLDKKFLGLTPQDEGPDELELLNDAQELIKNNIYERNSDWKTEKFHWEKNFYLIGVDGTGGKYYLNLNDNKCRVYFYHISDDDILVEADSMNEFIKNLIEMTQDVSQSLELIEK